MDFPAGSAAVREEDRQKVARLAKALAERPQLKLDIPLHTLGLADDRALALAALAQATAAQESELSAATAPASRARGRGRGIRGAAPGPPKSGHLLALEALYRAQFQAAPMYPAQIGTASASQGAAPATPADGAPAATESDPRAAWLERQLLVKFLPNGAQREALGRARADAVEAAVLAAAQLSAERIFLTNRLSGGGPPGMSRMELQLR